MIIQTIIPDLDAIPVPAPLWLLKTLLLLTFLLHLIAMNILIGSALTAVLTRFHSKSARREHSKYLFSEIIRELPTFVAATVTLGVAPLLFVQILYGNLVYTSSIAIGWFWWWIFPLIIIAYYIFYYLKFKSLKTDKPAALKTTFLIWIAAVVLFWISFVFSNNFNLAMQPARFSALILKCAKGLSLNLGDPVTFPRWLHITLGAIAVSGVYRMWRGRSVAVKDAAYSSYQLNLGYRLFIYPTMANILIGFVYLILIPDEIMRMLMGQDVVMTALWLAGLGAAMWAMPALKRTIDAPQSLALPLGTMLIVITLISMVILRDMVRTAYQKPFFHLSMTPLDVALGPIIMFLLAFVIGIGIFWWLVKVYVKKR